MTKRVNTDSYMEFVNAVTSEESKDYIPFNSRCFEIQSGDDGIPIHRLITAALGMGAESGEFTEVVKKIVFQGKPVNEDNIFHMKRELGDIMWYVAQACMSLDTTIDEINVNLLNSICHDLSENGDINKILYLLNFIILIRLN